MNGEESDWSDDDGNNNNNNAAITTSQVGESASGIEDAMQIDDQESRRTQEKNDSDDDDGAVDESNAKLNSKSLFGDYTSSSDEDEEADKPKKEPSLFPVKLKKQDRVTVGDYESEDEQADRPNNLFGDDESSSSSSSNGGSDDEMSGKQEIVLDLELTETKPLDGQQVYLLKVPNFLHFEPRPFDPDTFEGEVGDEEEAATAEDQEGLRQRIKLKVDNTVRWRFRNPDDKQLSNLENIQSNAKFVRWSDGSMSLMLGQECFDCNLTSLGDQHQYLYQRDPNSTVLQARTKLCRSLVMRPYGMGSRTHKKLTATVLQRHKKTTKTKSYSLIADPEAAKQQAEKLEQEKLRNRKRLEARQTRYMELTEDALEADEIAGFRNKRFRGTSGTRSRKRYNSGEVGETDDEEDEEEYGSEDGLDGFIVNDYDDDEEEVGADDSEEEEEEEEEEGELSGSEIDWEAEREREQRILAAKSAPQQQSTIADKKRRLIVNDEEDE